MDFGVVKFDQCNFVSCQYYSMAIQVIVRKCYLKLATGRQSFKAHNQWWRCEKRTFENLILFCDLNVWYDFIRAKNFYGRVVCKRKNRLFLVSNELSVDVVKHLPIWWMWINRNHYKINIRTYSEFSAKSYRLIRAELSAFFCVNFCQMTWSLIAIHVLQYCSTTISK